MPTPVFQPYVPGMNDSVDGKIKGLSNAYIDMVQYMQWILSHLDEKNVMRAQEAIIARALVDELVVGQNVTMGPNATISWNQVTEQPYIPPPVYLPDYIKSTYIDSTNVVSPYITGGTLTGSVIRTGASGVRLNIDANGIVSYNEYNAQHGFVLQSGYAAYSSMLFKDNGNIAGGLMYVPGSVSASELQLTTASGYDLKIDAGGDLHIIAPYGKKTYFHGDVDFSGATVNGLAQIIGKFG